MPSRSVSWYVVPSGAVTANSGADWPTLSPTGGGDEIRYGGRPRVDGGRSTGGVAERRRHGDQQDHGHDDDASGERQLAAAERADQTVALAAVAELRVGPSTQIAVLNVEVARQEASQSKSIATPINATSRPPISDTTRPCRTSGAMTRGARS